METLVNMLESSPALFAAMAFVWGAVAASLAGVVAYRLPHQLGWYENPEPLTVCSPASRCDGCQAKISYLALIPIFGWLLTRGKCSKCGAKISPLYPAVELSVASASAAIAYMSGFSTLSVAAVVLLWVFVALSWCDAKDEWLPEVMTIPLFWAGLMLSPFEPDTYMRVSGALLGYSLMWVSQFVGGRSRGLDVMYGGDQMMAAAIGAWVGFWNIPYALLGAALFFLAYAVYARSRDRVQVPFGPALSVGGMAAILSILYGFTI